NADAARTAGRLQSGSPTVASRSSWSTKAAIIVSELGEAHVSEGQKGSRGCGARSPVTAADYFTPTRRRSTARSAASEGGAGVWPGAARCCLRETTIRAVRRLVNPGHDQGGVEHSSAFGSAPSRLRWMRGTAPVRGSGERRKISGKLGQSTEIHSSRVDAVFLRREPANEH